MLKRLASFIMILASLSLLSCKTNRLRHGQRQGLWITEDDNGGVIYKSRGRFRNDRERGTWKYFHGDTLIKKEKYAKNVSEIWFYGANKRVVATGKTQVDFDGIMLHWYYSGDWNFFDPDGRLLKTITYSKGNPVAEVSR
ncbi:hypothetical protein GZH53_18885 [Flavihumibacter sp. R14]|nr:hypothetical protein [Flavihumibacter soli]